MARHGGGGLTASGKPGRENMRENGASSGSLKEQALASSLDKDPDFLLGLLEKVDLRVPAPTATRSANGTGAAATQEASGNPVLEAFSRYKEAAGLAIERQQEELADAFTIPRCGPVSDLQSQIPGQESQFESALTTATQEDDEDGLHSHISVDEHSESVGCWQPGTALADIIPAWLSWLVIGHDDDEEELDPKHLQHGSSHPVRERGFAESTFELPSRFLRGGGLRRAKKGIAPPAAAFPAGGSWNSPTVPAAPSKTSSQLDLPVHPRMRQQPLSAIQEDVEPYKFNSAIFAEVDMHGLEALGLELAGDLSPAVNGLRGQGRACRGHIKCGRFDKRVKHGALLEEFVVVTELLLPLEADASQLKRLSTALLDRTVPRDDVCITLGVVPAKLKKRGSFGVWLGWSDPVGAACKQPEAVCLAEALLLHPPPDAEWRLTTARRICEAVQGIHAAGKSHGSLSPRNIWISRVSGAVSISECGLVDSVLAAGLLSKDDFVTHLGIEFGRYFAPETWQSRRPAGSAGDVWALALVLLELLGEVGPPHSECTTVQQLASKASSGQLAPNSPPRASLLDQLPLTRHTLDQCLCHFPGGRPQSRDVLSSLAVPDVRPASLSASQDLSRTQDSTTSSCDDSSSAFATPRALPAESTYDVGHGLVAGAAQQTTASDEDWPFVPRGHRR